MSHYYSYISLQNIIILSSDPINYKYKVVMQRCKKKLQQLRSSSVWNFSNRKTSSDQELQIFFETLSQEKHVHTIDLRWNLNPDIIRILSNPIFPALKSLCLGANNIYSLEGLAGLKVQNLTELLLWNNKIVDLRGLRKLKAPNLQHLDLSSNLILEIGWLSQLSANQLKRIDLDYNFIIKVEGLGKVPNFNKGGHFPLLSNPLITIFTKPARQGQHVAMQCILTSSRREINYS